MRSCVHTQITTCKTVTRVSRPARVSLWTRLTKLLLQRETTYLTCIHQVRLVGTPSLQKGTLQRQVVEHRVHLRAAPRRLQALLPEGAGAHEALEEPAAATAASPTASSGAKLSRGLVRTAGRSGEEGARRDQTTALLARITFPPSYQVPSLPSSTNKIYRHLSKCKQGFKGQLCPHWPTGITSKNTHYPKQNIFA